MAEETSSIPFYQSLTTVRAQSQLILEHVLAGNSPHFSVDRSKLPDVAAFVLELIDRDYEGDAGRIPFHSRYRHFEAGGIDRVSQLRALWDESSPSPDDAERTRRLLDLVVVSVLLDAGAGSSWRFHEEESGFEVGRSEGLGVASFHMFKNGLFSSDEANPHQADADALASLSVEQVAEGFQASEENPMVGLEGRIELLRSLGRTLSSEENSEIFTRDGVTRFGFIFDFLKEQAGAKGVEGQFPLSLELLWGTLLPALTPLWPQGGGRVSVEGVFLGDVWAHSCLPVDRPFVPFHKLTQWLCYSLLEPLSQEGHCRILHAELQTGLPEYRNGGLLVDFGVLRPLDPALTSEPQAPSSEAVVEWRALTVALLDEVYEAIVALRGEADPEAFRAGFPMVKMLEGGTWKAGREIARQLRGEQGGGPPIQIQSDGTVF